MVYCRTAPLSAVTVTVTVVVVPAAKVGLWMDIFAAVSAAAADSCKVETE